MGERKQTPPQDGALFIEGDDVPILDEDPEIDPEPGEPGDGKAELAADVLQDILDRMDLEADVTIRDDDERVVLDVAGPDAGRAIGKKGQTLDALQFLINKICNRFPEGRRHIIVDSGDYRDRHDRNLVSRAKREAKKAVHEGKVVTLEPMSARDRRVIHLSLAKFEGVETCSQGEGTRRRIQIIPQRVVRRRR
ncbi:MAG: KH domain-containing protein [Myxococcota bacterium]